MLRRNPLAAGIVVVLAALVGVQAHARGASSELAGASALEEIKKRKAIRVGFSTFVPWAMRDSRGDFIGFEIDVARKLAEDNGWRVEHVFTAWDGIIPALVAGEFDVIIGGMSATPKRSRTVNFTIPYACSTTSLAANRAARSLWTASPDPSTGPATATPNA